MPNVVDGLRTGINILDQTKRAANGFFHFEPYTVSALSTTASRLLVALIRWMIGGLGWSVHWKKTLDCGGKTNLTGNNKNWYWNIAKFITQNWWFLSPSIHKIALEGALLKAVIISFHFICRIKKKDTTKVNAPLNNISSLCNDYKLYRPVKLQFNNLIINFFIMRDWKWAPNVEAHSQVQMKQLTENK